MYKTIKSCEAEHKPPLTQVIHVAHLFSVVNSILTILGGFVMNAVSLICAHVFRQNHYWSSDLDAQSFNIQSSSLTFRPGFNHKKSPNSPLSTPAFPLSEPNHLAKINDHLHLVGDLEIKWFAACWWDEKPHRESLQSSRFDPNRQYVLTVLKFHHALFFNQHLRRCLIGD